MNKYLFYFCAAIYVLVEVGNQVDGGRIPQVLLRMLDAEPSKDCEKMENYKIYSSRYYVGYDKKESMCCYKCKMTGPPHNDDEKCTSYSWFPTENKTARNCLLNTGTKYNDDVKQEGWFSGKINTPDCQC